MNDPVSQFFSLFMKLPLSKKISMAFILALVVAGFALMFFYVNQVDYQILYSNLSPREGGAIVSKIQERNIPYRIEGNGTVIMVPAEKVYELRLSLAGDGLPSGGSVGFEIFDKSDFRTTKFVQELNYRRALEGELSRTITEFKEVNKAKVHIVIPRESLFVEDTKPASASIQLSTRSSVPPKRLAAIVHLVSNAVEGLDSEHITVVDTNGRIIFKGEDKGDASSLLSGSQLEYKRSIENEIKENVETMLEGIVGVGKAIVRVNAEIDFNKITLSEEEYDPSATVVRSAKNIKEIMQAGGNGSVAEPTEMDIRRGVLGSQGAQKSTTKTDDTTNYEINRITRSIIQPAGTIKRLSLAVAIDQKVAEAIIESTKGSKNNKVTKETFDEIVKRAMGHSEDREDLFKVELIPFAETTPDDMQVAGEDQKTDWLKLVGNYKGTIFNFLLVAMVFLLVVRPLLKSIKNISEEVVVEREALPPGSGEYAQLPESGGIDQKARIQEMTQRNPEKAQQLIKGWIGERE